MARVSTRLSAIAVAFFFLPGAALAQPVETDAAEGAPAEGAPAEGAPAEGAPAEGARAGDAPAPASAPAPAPAPAPTQAPAPAPAPQQAGYAETAPVGRDGMTFEAGIGLGFLRVAPDGGGNDTEFGPLGGPNIGVGGFINPRLAVTGRLAGVSWFESENGASGRITSYFLGPSLQYWPTEELWLGGGIGLGITQISFSAMGQSESDSESDFALNLRGGYSFPTSTRNSFNVSVEMTPVFHDGASVTGMALLAGYQYL